MNAEKKELLDKYFKEVLDAAKRLDGTAIKTSLIYSDVFSDISNNKIYIKPENFQVTGSFKLRGAYNKISKMSEADRQKGLIAASAGNHAQGVAYAAQKLGAKAVIAMPKSTPLIKVESTQKFGAEVVLHGSCFDEAYSEALRLKEENGYTLVHPFDDIDVIAGQGTIAIEILEQLKDADCIIAPIGGGGLMAGVAIAAKAINPNIRVIGVEPDGANAMKQSIKRNKIVNLETVATIADGVAVKNPGVLTFSIINDFVDEIVTVSDFDILDAFLILLEKHKLVSETSGALPLAALKKLDMVDKKIVCLVSGGNIDLLNICSMVNKGLVDRERICCFSLELVDTPGELLKVSEILGRLNVNVIKLDHDKLKMVDSFTKVRLEVTMETNGHAHAEKIMNEFIRLGFDITRIY
jgi:threonine dehydratase